MHEVHELCDIRAFHINVAFVLLLCISCGSVENRQENTLLYKVFNPSQAQPEALAHCPIHKLFT